MADRGNGANTSPGREATTAPGEPDDGAPTPSRASRRGLDWFVFFVADIQTGFGPFVAVYLTAEKWNQVDIGLILTVGGLIGLIGQIPGGAIVDAVRSTRLLAAIAVIAIGASAFALAAWPIFIVVLASRIVHAAASCVLGPAIAALSLGLVHRNEIGARFGRNASFASIGTGLAAAGMGLCGYYLSNQAVFFVAAGLVVPAVISLFQIRAAEIDPVRAHGGSGGSAQADSASDTWIGMARAVLGNRPLLIFAGCAILFHLANAAMLPLVASMLTLRSSHSATLMVAASMVVPQFIVAVLSPWIGRLAHSWGRRPLLLIGFAALPVRGLLFAVVTNPYHLMVVQFLDGFSAAVLGVLVPLTIADVTRRTGHFNLAQGTVGCAMGIGASLSTTMTGYISDQYGSYTAFLTLAMIAALGFSAVLGLMPETRPPRSGKDGKG